MIIPYDRWIPYLHESARRVLDAERERFAGVLEPGIGGLETAEDGEVRWWTFAGGKRNGTLRYALEIVGGDWKVVPDNLAVRVRPGQATDAPVDRRSVEEAIARVTAPGFWDEPGIHDALVKALPKYRVSKFQGLMPGWVEAEVLGRELIAGFGERGG